MHKYEKGDVILETKFYELKDGRSLGVKLFEVVSLPSISVYEKTSSEACEKIATEFTRLMVEMHKLCGNNTCIELLWITERVQNQTFLSRIRLVCILRVIGVDRQCMYNELYGVENDFITTLTALQFNVENSELTFERSCELLKSVDDSCAYGIVKREKCIVNANSLYPYYFSEIVPNRNVLNYNAIVSALSEQENCCISFQIFPTKFTSEEVIMINEVTAELSHIANGTMVGGQLYRDITAEEPLKVFSYYNERRNSPIFTYNILVFGKKTCCASIAAKVVSLLQGGVERITTSDFMCVDLSGEKIKLEKHFSFYSWNINNRLLYYYRNKNLQNTIPLAKKLFRLPYVMSVEEVASFFRLPLYEKSMIALRNNQWSRIQEQFSDDVVSENNIQFGELAVNTSSKILIGCAEKAFTKHALIVGTPGSGKTTFSLNLLLQFAKKKIPFLAIEPTKTEYRALLYEIPELNIFTPGNNTVSPYIVNPFIPPSGIKIEQYIPSLASAFKAAFSMPSPLDVIFFKAIRSCYIQYGWKDFSQAGDEDVTPFGLYEFILVFKNLIKNTKYSEDVRGNIESAGILRLTNLIEQNSNIYDSINTVPIEDLLMKPTVLELNAIDNAEQKSLIMALLLINICLYTKRNLKGDGELKNIILIDEAHVLLSGGTSSGKGDRADSQASTVKALQDMIAEIRSYGTGIIIADQAPTKVSREVVANTDIKVTFRLVEPIERKLIADSTNMDEEMLGNLPCLKTGEAYVYYSKLGMPQMICTQNIKDNNIRPDVSDMEVKEHTTYWETRSELLKPYAECKYCHSCSETCDFAVRSNAEFIANSAFIKYQSSLKNLVTFKKCIFHLPTLMKDEFEKCKTMDLHKLQICSRIKLLGKLVWNYR